jgi:hypothetical protein
MKIEELSFIPAEEREAYFRLINEGTLPSTHITENDGSWDLPEPDDRIINAVSERVLVPFLTKTK